MTTVIATHQIKDPDLWHASTRRAEAFATIGVTDLRVFVDPQDPHKVGLSAEVPDLDALMAALQSPEWGEAMAADGVLAETVALFVER